MNMAVQHRYRTEALDVRQSLFTVVGSPTPIGIDGPQRNMCKEHNRSAGRAALEIVLQPFQLFVAERPHAAGFQVRDIHEANEMYALLIEAVPATALCTLPIALE